MIRREWGSTNLVGSDGCSRNGRKIDGRGIVRSRGRGGRRAGAAERGAELLRHRVPQLRWQHRCQRGQHVRLNTCPLLHAVHQRALHLLHEDVSCLLVAPQVLFAVQGFRKGHLHLHLVPISHTAPMHLVHTNIYVNVIVLCAVFLPITESLHACRASSHCRRRTLPDYGLHCRLLHCRSDACAVPLPDRKSVV